MSNEFAVAIAGDLEPGVHLKFDLHERASGQAQTGACQQQNECFQAWIVPNDENSLVLARLLPQHFNVPVRRRQIEFVKQTRRACQLASRHDSFRGRSGTLGGRAQNQIRLQALTAEQVSDAGSIVFAALVQRAIVIAPARFAPTGLGMPKD